MSQWWEWNPTARVNHSPAVMSPGTSPVGGHWSVACHPLYSWLLFLCTNPPKNCSSLLCHDPHGRKAIKAIKAKPGNGWLLWSKLFQHFWYQGLFGGFISSYYLLHKIAHIFRVYVIKACQQILFAQGRENLLFKHCYHCESAEMVIKRCNDRNIINRV